jgi:hypothetical protein
VNPAVGHQKHKHYLFTQDDIGKEYDFIGIANRGEIKKTRGDWFTRCITVKTVRK